MARGHAHCRHGFCQQFRLLHELRYRSRTCDRRGGHILRYCKSFGDQGTRTERGSLQGPVPHRIPGAGRFQYLDFPRESTCFRPWRMWDLCVWLVPNFPWIFFLGYGFIYTPMVSYITARMEGIAGQFVSLPLVREVSFIAGAQFLRLPGHRNMVRAYTDSQLWRSHGAFPPDRTDRH
jgi:hypothetical protein